MGSTLYKWSTFVRLGTVRLGIETNYATARPYCIILYIVCKVSMVRPSSQACSISHLAQLVRVLVSTTMVRGLIPVDPGKPRFFIEDTELRNNYKWSILVRLGTESRPITPHLVLTV